LLTGLVWGPAANSSGCKADGAAFEERAAGLDLIFERHRVWIVRVRSRRA
jgi:hypothetical protein